MRSLVTGALALALTAAPMVAVGPSAGSAGAAGLTSALAAPAADPSVASFSSAPTSTSVTLRWIGMTSGRTYTVRRDDGTGTPSPTTGTPVYEGTSFRAVDSAVEPWTTYRYTIWADDGAGGYLAPRSVSATTSIQPVRDLAASKAGATGSTISWTSPGDPGVAAVTVTRTDPKGTVRTVYSGTATSAADTGLTPGVPYSYTAVAEDASGRRGPVSPNVLLTTNRTWTTTTASPYAGWPAALACATTTWCIAVNGTGTFQVMSGSTWSVPVRAFAADPNPERLPAMVTSLTCPAAGRCLAVRSNMLVEFVGGSWRSAGAPSSGWSSVDCPTTTWCVAIRRDGWSTTRTGTTWTAPVPIGTLRGVDWWEVACQAPARCFAVATGTSTQSNWRATLTSSWSTGFLGSRDYGNAYRISCSTSTCLGLGDRVRVTVSGTSWSIAALPPGTDLDDFTNDLSCGTPSLCVALNYANIARWSSTAVLERTKLSAGIGQMAGVSCPRTGGACFAFDNRGRFYRWTASAHWVHVSTPVPTSGGVNLIGCLSSTSCSFFDHNGWLVVWNGTSWTRTSKLFTQRAFVECSGSGFCIAVEGTTGAYRVWSGGAWGALTSMPIAATDVSCGSPTLCMAVDWEGRASRFNGSSWSAPVVALSSPSGGSPEVSCYSGGCMLVSFRGVYRRYVGTAFTATQRLPQGLPADDIKLSCIAASWCVGALQGGSWMQWNGTTWTAHVTSSSPFRFGSLTCLTSTHCVATHPYSNDTVPMVWNSGTWSDDGSYAETELPRAPECPTMQTCFIGGGAVVSRSS